MGIIREHIRRSRRGNRVGFLVTLALHGGVLVVVGIAHSQPASVAKQRHFVLAEIVKLGTPPDDRQLPRITLPLPPTAPQKVLNVTNNPDARPARREEKRPEDPKPAKQPRNVPRPPLWMESIEPEKTMGAADGSVGGTSQKAVGDRYLAEIAGVLRQNYFLPAGMAPDQIPTPPEIRFRFSDDGSISDVTLTKPSGNALVDDACLDAARMTRKIPAPPASFAPRGLSVGCDK